MSKKEMLDHMKDLEAMCTNVCLDLWNHPETGGNEKRSADLMRELLTKEGFTITNNEHLPHAFYAEYGSGSTMHFRDFPRNVRSQKSR